jgi:3-hydroxyacyl-[acyl-carrier-protein] dehydratase
MEDALNLYSFERRQADGVDVVYDVVINDKCSIFSGHFPHQPVLPGVMIIRLFALCSSDYLGLGLKVKEVTQCKFLRVVDPKVNNKLAVHIDMRQEDDVFIVRAELKSEGIIFSKASLTLIKAG